eukprot:GFUD01038665.1.p1 GENE.GFUD01038665.1~~GFUD01038665.1.p1  ORF type:complete len:412 (-),score=128.46 GFUD01038665.1:120-1355(-)
MFQLQQAGTSAIPDQLHQAVNIDLQQEEQQVKGPRQRKEKNKNAFTDEGLPTEQGAIPAHINPHHRILRLEKNIAWLQDQHNQMLSALHNEIETLKTRNRELQFQLLMGRSSPLAPLGTPEDLELSAGGGSRGLALISQLSGVPPLQAEILDNEIKELQSTLHEARSRNVYLSSLVDQQKKKLAKLEEEASIESIPTPPSKLSPSSFELIAQRSPTPPTIPSEFLKKLAEAEDLVNQLQRENESQREELAAIKNTVERDTRMKYRGCNHPVRNFRNRMGTSSKSFDSREPSAGSIRIRGNIRDYRSTSTSKLDLKQSERFPPLKAMSVSRRPRRPSREGEFQAPPGSSGSDSSLHTVTPLPRLRPHNSQPSLQLQGIAQTKPTVKGKAAGRRLPRESGPRYGSLDRKHSRS